MPQPDEPTSTVVPAQLAAAGLTEATIARLLESVPANTGRSWESRWHAYTVWCAIEDIAELPCTAEQLASYVQARTEPIPVPAALQRWARVTEYAPLGVGSLRLHLGSLLKVMRLLGANPPDPVPARQVIDGLARNLAADPTQDIRVRKATPAVAEQTKKMVDVQDLDTAAGLRNRALLLLGYNTGRRVGDLVMLALDDVQLTPDLDPERHPLGILVNFRAGTTGANRLGQGSVVPVKWVGGTYCAAKAVTDWMRYLADRGYSTGPLFPRLDKHGNIGAGSASPAADRGSGAITTRAAARIVADAAHRARDLQQQAADAAQNRGEGTPAGEEQARYSGDSLRRGYLTDVLGDPTIDMDKAGRRAGFAPGSRHLHPFQQGASFGWDDDPAASKLAEIDESDRG